ncbi:MAG: NRDE family protein [Gammaproteobacteria bacterium]|nr:NRDE family protein [Gammaproteobacteria bacterium]
MCVIFLAWRRHPDYRLVVAANRDEFYARPTAPAGYWPEAPDVLAGRDLEGGGTWLGVTRAGRFAALTNYRRGDGHIPDAPTRGRLVSDFLLSASSPGEYLQSLAQRAGDYNGFNLLVGDGESLHWFSNCGGEPSTLEPGIYAVSNDLLDTPWPKIMRGKDGFGRLLEARDIDLSAMFELLMDRQTAADGALPDTGIGLSRERALSPIFIAAGDYGTRSSTVLLIEGTGDLSFHERTHEPGIAGTETLTYTFPVDSDREAV